MDQKTAVKLLNQFNKHKGLLENASVHNGDTVDHGKISLLTRPYDYKYDVAMGRRENRSTINKWGHNEDLAQNVEELVSDWGGTFDPNTDIISTAQTLTITYNNLTDGAGQTGALILLIDYLDENFNLAQAYHTLGSSGSDVTSFTCFGVNSVDVVANGGLGWNANDITFTATTDATIQARVSAGSSNTDQMIYHTPINHALMIDWFFGNVIKLAGGSTPKVSFKFYSWSRVTMTRYEVGHVKIDTSVQDVVSIKPSQPFVIGEREVFYIAAESDANNTEIELRFSGILEKI